MPLYYNTFTDDLNLGWMYSLMLLNCAFYSNQTANLIKLIWSFISFQYFCAFTFVLYIYVQKWNIKLINKINK